MTRSSCYQRPTCRLAGVLLALLAVGVIAPQGVRAGCSHLVRSHADRYIASASTASLMRDLAVPSDPLPSPSGPRPCSGAYCSGQPAAPAVPTAIADGRISSWAWCPALPGSAPAGPSFLSSESNDPRPMHRWIAVFRPPRHLPPV